MSDQEAVIEINKLGNYLGEKWVHRDLDLTIKKGEIIAIIGASGCGKTTLLRTILMLRKANCGQIKVLGTDIAKCSYNQAQAVRARWGVMFQSGALFSSLNVMENVMFPLKEYVDLPLQTLQEMALFKIKLAGLELDAACKKPAELSGGMIKRVALARAIVMDPELLFLDEPTSGLDPKSAGALDELILHLRESLGLTLLMITHDLDTLWRVPDRVVFMGEGKVLAALPMQALVKEKHPLIRDYFGNPRSMDRLESRVSSG